MCPLATRAVAMRNPLGRQMSLKLHSATQTASVGGWEG